MADNMHLRDKRETGGPVLTKLMLGVGFQEGKLSGDLCFGQTGFFCFFIKIHELAWIPWNGETETPLPRC